MRYGASIARPIPNPLKNALPGSMPPMTRRPYALELRSAMFMPIALACVEGGIISVIAAKAFDAPAFIIAILSAAPALANIASAFWVRWMMGIDRVRVCVLFQVGILACLLGIATAPFSDLGLAMLTAFMLAARSFMAGIFTARADIWQANYPRDTRARISSNITRLTRIVDTTTALTVGFAVDTAIRMNPDFGAHAYRIMYVAAAALALPGIWAFSRVRWRGGKTQLAEERRVKASKHADDESFGPMAMWRVLRDDALYRQYMVAQMLLGIPNLAALPVIVLSIEDSFTLDYGPTMALTQAIPFGVAIFAMPLWARMLDRTHIIRFRAYHSWVFVAANAMTGAALLLGNLPLLFAARTVLGIAFGGGMIAWQIGHHDFAPRQLATVYMGVHVTLTGVRGVVAPFIGVLLYEGFMLAIGDESYRMPALGGWSFVLFALFGVIGGVLFVRLHLAHRAEQRDDDGGLSP